MFKAAKEVGKGYEDSLALAVVKEGNETKKFGSWCGMVQVYGAAAAIGCFINMHYPEVNQRIRPFMNTIVQPSESATSQNNDIHIMWSSTTQPATLKGNVQLNHFVPLLPTSATNLSYHAESDIPASDCCDEPDSDKLESTFGFSDDENASEFFVMKTLRKSRKSKRIEPKPWSLSGFQTKSPRVCAIPSNMVVTVELCMKILAYLLTHTTLQPKKVKMVTSRHMAMLLAQLSVLWLPLLLSQRVLKASLPTEASLDVQNWGGGPALGLLSIVNCLDGHAY